MGNEILDIQNVSFSYNGIPVLEEVSLKLNKNDFLGIIGPNGGGKTTLLKIMLGMEKPHKGEVSLFGLPPVQGRRKAGYVPQYHVYESDFPASVMEVVLTGCLTPGKIFKRYSEADKETAHKAMMLMNITDLKDKQIGKLSGGQQQRVLIARALVSEPRLLLLDEPASGIDTHMQKEFYELLSELKKRMAIILISHDLTAVSVYVDKIACLNRKLYYHNSKEIHAKDLEAIYQCPVELIAHDTIPHRVLKQH